MLQTQNVSKNMKASTHQVYKVKNQRLETGTIDGEGLTLSIRMNFSFVHKL